MSISLQRPEEPELQHVAVADPCSHCGACLSFCAWDAADREQRPTGPELCRDCQVCYRICPRLPFDRATLAASMFDGAQDGPWGRYLAAHSVRTASPLPASQDGGLTSRLLQYLLEERLVEAALVTTRQADWAPEAGWATTPAEIAHASGSKYTTAPALAALADGLERFHGVAIVALPCQAAAIARLSQLRPGYREKIRLVIGLFCSETFYAGDGALWEFIRAGLGRPISEVDRFDIKRGRFSAQAGEARVEWRIKEVHKYAWPICTTCPDLTSEFADLSIGSAGSADGCNTVIVRSRRGQDLFEAGVNAGLWTSNPLENPEAVVKQSERKRTNVAQLPVDDLQRLGRGSIRGNWRRQQRREAR
jgi:coenzyme F420 hydrogenase subunit beta